MEEFQTKNQILGCKTLQPFNGDYHSVSDLLFINDEFNFLIACCDWECKESNT